MSTDQSTLRKPSRLRIGEVAAQAQVSTRTLRYYEELGLLSPSGYSPGGARRYSDQDVERLLRIRELQSVMGFDLDQIRTILVSEDRLNQLRAEFQSGDLPPARQEEIVREAIGINDELRQRVRDQQATARAFLDEMEGKARKFRRYLKALDQMVAAR
jgi:MerR family transcriptional regulator, repressor of the yfmOP operon